MDKYEKELVKINEQKLKLKIKELEVKNKRIEDILKKIDELVGFDTISQLEKYIGQMIETDYGKKYKITPKSVKNAVQRMVKELKFKESDFREEK